MSPVSKKYWMHQAELVDAVATQATDGVASLPAKEFLSDPRDEQLESGEFSRREFLKLMGISTVLAGAAACSRRPVEKIVPYLNRPEELAPGIPNWYASTADCPCGCGVLVKTREGRPIKLEGNPDHPVNRGGLCAFAQTAVWNLYDPDRLQVVAKRERHRNVYQSIDWGTADMELREKLKSAKSVRFLTGTISGPAEQKILTEFLSSLHDGKHVVCDALNTDEIATAAEQSYKMRAVPTLRFDRAKVVVSLGSDFLGSGHSPVEHAKDWASLRRLNPEKPQMSRLIAFEPTLSLTGTNADERYPVRATQLPRLAFALAHQMFSVLSHGEARLVNALAPFAISKTAPILEIPAAVLERVARELWEARGASLVVGGSLYGAGGVALQLAVNCLNDALGNDGHTVDWSRASHQSLGNFAALQELIAEMRAGKVDALVISGVNPAYSLPARVEFAKACEKVPLVVYVADRVDETGALADFVLPVSHFLERWGDAETRTGVFSVVQPTIQPLYETRSLGEMILIWQGKEPKDLYTQWHDYIRTVWKEKIYPHADSGVDFEMFWEGVLRAGVFSSTVETSTAPAFAGDALISATANYAGADGQSFELLVTPSLALHDGRYANNSWMQEFPDPVTKITWDNYVSVAQVTAKELGLDEGDVVHVNAGDNLLFTIPVHVQPGQHPKVFTVHTGYGRHGAGRVAGGVGVNVSNAQRVDADFLARHTSDITLAKTGARVELACTQGHHRLDVKVGNFLFAPRPIVQEATLAEIVSGHGDTNDHVHAAVAAAGATSGADSPAEGVSEREPTMWGEPYKYPGHRWGMAIDLSTCTGCSACVLACQVENNVPAVGKTQVLKGREMHWLRIDRYYTGDVENPETVHQPMLCQHCEKAPCETVCPVLATVHDSEGLNVQVYNRCVGTRYCSNNCPYKVRRFNWFDYGNRNRAAFAWPEPLHLMLNPDVTVREKGVMEKCTFCIQRIRTTKEDAKMRGDALRDGELQTACQQSCPTNAIIFGDINDPEARVTKLAKAKRGFHTLGELNILPQVTYLTKVRNKEA